jgi:hypothetical protein
MIMQIQPVCIKSNNKQHTNFKSVYPVYHWYKPNDKFIPATDLKIVHKFQRLLTGLLVKGNKYDLSIPGKTFIHGVMNFIANNDNDYKNIPYVRSFYNAKGGCKRDWKGEIYDIVPSAYLLTGNDAVDFENLFGKPIGRVRKTENYSEKEILAEIRKAKIAYATKGPKFIKERANKFVDKETSRQLELHTIFTQPDKNKPPKLIKLGFFTKGGENNPFIKNGILW